jgi:spectinomycin phosphotransferase
VRSLPADLLPGRLETALAEAWQLAAASMDYLPVGGGGYHWQLADERGQLHFVTVDDLDAKEWLGDKRCQTYDGLRRCLGTAAALRSAACLEFVVTAVPTCDGELLRRIDDRYSVSVFPFLTGRSYKFGRYEDAVLRDQALYMIAALHQATPVVKDLAPHHLPFFSGRADLAAFLLAPDRPWHAGPLSEDARQLLVPRAAELADLTAGFDRLVEATAVARANTVVTHGEPHPGNLMSVNDRPMLIDWDTVALAPPERDVCLIAEAGDDGTIIGYQELTGRELDPAVLTLYRLRWCLDDLTQTISMFRNGHSDTPDTRFWLNNIAPQLEQLPRWLESLG